MHQDSLTTATAGKLTVGTDNPAYPPYYAEMPRRKTDALGARRPDQRAGLRERRRVRDRRKLGFAKADVAWIVVPFANSFAPGPKTFDIDLNQVNYSPSGPQAADLSKGYYFGNQALVVLKASPLAKATASPR